MEGVIFTSAIRDFLRLRRLVVWIIVAFALFGIGLVYKRVNPDVANMEGYVLLTATFVYRVLALAAAIFSTAVVSQEVEQRTIVYLLTRPIPRWKLLVFRTLAASVAVFVVSTLAALGTSFAFFRGVSPQLGHDLIGLAVGSLAYTSLFMLVSLFVNRAMIPCLLFAFGWETFVGDVPGDMRWISVNSYLASISQRPASSTSSGILEVVGGLMGKNTIPLSVAWIVMGCVVAFAFTFGAYWFTTNEYIAREDAE